MWFSEIGIHNNERGGVLVDNFKGHRTDDVKTYLKSFKRNIDLYYSLELCSFLIMAGGVTPKSQSINAFVVKVFKGLITEYYDNYMINADENEAGHHIPPSKQLMVIWVVKAWNDVPKELIKKSWKVCGYKISEEL